METPITDRDTEAPLKPVAFRTDVLARLVPDEMQAAPETAAPARPVPAPGRKFYLSVPAKFAMTFLFSVLWAALSVYLSQPWTRDLAAYIGYPLALTLIAGIAIIPGFMNAFMVGALMLDRRPAHPPLSTAYPALSILIAADKEEESIIGTLESIARQGYPGKLQVIVINDGSPDRTAELVPYGVGPRREGGLAR